MSLQERADKLALLAAELLRMGQAGEHLSWSLERSKPLLAKHSWAAEDLERLESLASRFARFADLLSQRIMRLADELELESPGSLIDRIHRAEKRGWVDADGDLVRMRELRNLIAHEYEDEDLPALYREVMRLTPVLLAAIPRVQAWSQQLK